MKKEYFTTIQAAKILNVSTSTVQRMYDKGILWGEKNPITKRRKVDYRSIQNLAKSAGLKI